MQSGHSQRRAPRHHDEHNLFMQGGLLKLSSMSNRCMIITCRGAGLPSEEARHAALVVEPV